MNNVVTFKPRPQPMSYVEIDGGIDQDDPAKPFLYYVMVHRDDGTSWPEWVGQSYEVARHAAEAARQTWKIARPVADRIAEEEGRAQNHTHLWSHVEIEGGIDFRDGSVFFRATLFSVGGEPMILWEGDNHKEAQQVAEAASHRYAGLGPIDDKYARALAAAGSAT